MALRAEQAVMLGVVGLGLFAAWRLINAPKNQGPNEPIRDPNTVPPPVGGNNLASGTHVQLAPGRWYHGRLELPQVGAQGAPDISGLSIASTRAQIEQALRVIGFDLVEVYTSLAEAQGRATGLENPTEGSRWFLARARPDVPRTPFPRPPQLIYLTYTAVPPLAEQPKPALIAGHPAYFRSPYMPQTPRAFPWRMR